MNQLYDQIQTSKDFIQKFFKENITHGIVLGTGHGAFTDDLTNKISIPYKDIPFFPKSTVDSHKGELVIGNKYGKPIIVLSGRFHYYEGYSSQQLTFPIRVMHALGVRHLILTNAAGGVNPHFCEGDLVLIQDHINLMPDHPLRGENEQRLGPRFPDMLNAYDADENQGFLDIAKELDIGLKQGIYLGLQGPSLETPAEYKMIKILGGDLVGMSTIPEVIVARHCGMKVTAFSIVSNVCFPKSVLTPTTVEHVIAVVTNSANKIGHVLDHYFMGSK